MKTNLLAKTALFVSALGLTACATIEPDQPASAIGNWRVVAIDGRNTADRLMTARFTASDGTANFGCNTGSGPLQTRDGWIWPGEWSVTLLACEPAERMRLEQQGFAILSKPARVSVHGNGIRISNVSGVLDMVPAS